MRHTGLATICTVLCLLAAVPSAEASATSRQLSVGGFVMSWPSDKTVSMPPGSSVIVNVRVRSAERTRHAKLAFARVTARGAVMRVHHRAAIRNGKFTATVPAGAPTAARYRLSVRVGKSTRSVIIVPAAGQGDANAPAPGPIDPCSFDVNGTNAGSVQVTPTSVPSGQPVTVTIANIGTNCLNYGGNLLEWQRADPTGWTTIPDNRPVPSALALFPAGESRPLGAVEPPQQLTPGHYRIVATFHAGSSYRGAPAPAYAEFDVTG